MVVQVMRFAFHIAFSPCLFWGLVAFGVDFNREVRPILSEHCFQCHGLDQQKSKLRLDFEEFAHKGGKSGRAAVAPGKPDHSEMISRVTDRGEDRMPPKGKRLTQTQVETLQLWIAEGGKYANHWAYVQPKRPALPASTIARTASTQSGSASTMASTQSRAKPRLGLSSVGRVALASASARTKLLPIAPAPPVTKTGSPS